MNKSSWMAGWRKGLLALTLGLAITAAAPMVKASDHDDGETNIKSRNRSLTDLYAFREDWQTGLPADQTDVVLVMNTNPRSVARQHYYFDTLARYNFFVTRVAVGANNGTPTGVPDMAIRFLFAAPNANNQQPITVQVDNFVGGAVNNSIQVAGGLTTPAAPGIGNPNPAPAINPVTVFGFNLQLFAGLREDPFFFDVEQFFRVRAAVLGRGPLVGFRPPATAIDFAKGYNVNAIVLDAPILFLSGGTPVRTFDIWETIEIQQ
jgi:hypothetical protein